MKDENIMWRLARWMNAKGFSAQEVDAFVARWKNLRDHESRPCPNCFIKEVGDLREQPLAAMPERGKYEPLYCAHCKTEYLIPLEE